MNAVIQGKTKCTKCLEADLYRQWEWSAKGKMIFNPHSNKPVEEVILSNRNATSYETVAYSGVEVIPGKYRNHEGCMLYCKMNCMKHIDENM